MSVTISDHNHEADILARVIAPEEPGLVPEAAQSLLQLAFSSRDQDRMHELAQKAQEGILSEEERAELDSYERVGCLLGILQSKARVSLKKGTSAS